MNLQLPTTRNKCGQRTGHRIGYQSGDVASLRRYVALTLSYSLVALLLAVPTVSTIAQVTHISEGLSGMRGLEGLSVFADATEKDKVRLIAVHDEVMHQTNMAIIQGYILRRKLSGPRVKSDRHMS